VSDDSGQLRTTFDSAADLYQQARPEYPEALYDALIAAAGLGAGDRLLELGCATGKATLPLARRGFRITCVELGPALASAARRNLASFPEVEVVESAFETWDQPAADPFELVFAATAWHWLDPAIRYRRAWERLRRGGHLAFWSAVHVFPHGGDLFFAELQEVYDEIGEGLPEGANYPRPGELPDEREEIERSGLFDDIVVRHFDWEVEYDADGYLRLLDTFSGHITMQPWQRDRLYSEIRRRLAKRADGRLHRGWGASFTSPAAWRHPAPRTAGAVAWGSLLLVLLAARTWWRSSSRRPVT
jgi:SAM-dependent methyltransferase